MICSSVSACLKTCSKCPDFGETFSATTTLRKTWDTLEGELMGALHEEGFELEEVVEYLDMLDWSDPQQKSNVTK